MRDSTKIMLMAMGAIVVFGVGIYVSASVWNECRADGHSFLYCMKLMGR